MSETIEELVKRHMAAKTDWMKIPPAPNFEEHALFLAQLAAKTSFLPSVDVVERLERRPVFPATRLMARRATLSDDRTCMYDDNCTPHWALLWSHGYKPGDRKGWTFAHVWSLSKDIKAYTNVANVVLLPECLASLTDKDGPVAPYLRWHAKEVYKWIPDDCHLPESPPHGYDQIVWRYLESKGDPIQNLRTFLEASNDKRAKLIRSDVIQCNNFAIYT